ncbi:MAG: hypothetical protein IKG87_10155 [Clostridia bacterium]|nr:hypothetical protein [Clostridia bacterium]
MTSLLSAVGTLPGTLVYFAAALLTAAQLTILLVHLRRKSRLRVPAALAHFLAGLFLLSVLLDYSYNAVIEGMPEGIYGFEIRLLSLPWLLYMGAELLSAAAVFLEMRSIRRYRDTHLNADAIRQAVDLLPAALMVSGGDGTVLLANLKMTELCRELTGETLSDARRFRRQVENASDADHLVHTPAGETWQFTQSRITLDGREYNQLSAADRTEKYRVTKELLDKNGHLQDVQFRMRAVAAGKRELIAAREVMNARKTVHDRMGGVLLAGKYYLDHPENMKEEELLHLLEYNNYFLLGEVEQPRNEGDPVEEAVRAARRIGVAVEIRGAVPAAEPARGLIAQAIVQCASNAVRHAGGDRLDTVITESEAAVTAAFSNNGTPPKGPVTETGGLAVLRKAVEEAGGSMAIQSEPAFCLTLFLPFF